MLRNDMEGHWDAYKDVQNQIFTELQGSTETPKRTAIDYPAPHWECIYCHIKFDTLEQIQQHYSGTPVGGDPVVIALSRRGYTDESWRRGQKVINAPTIKAVQG